MNFKELVEKVKVETPPEEGKPETTQKFAKMTPNQPPVVFDTDIRYDGIKIAKELDPAGSIQHNIGHALKRQDRDNDGDVDSQDTHTPDEVPGTPDQTKHMLNKDAAERKHTKKGVAYESVQTEEKDEIDTADVKATPSGRKVRAHKIEVEAIEIDADELEDEDEDEEDEEEDDMKEEMSDAQMKKREDIVKGMKKSYSGFVKKYGADRAKSVMYATATKMAMKEEVDLEEGRPSQRHPLEGHPYHKKTDAELTYIGKDAHAAAKAMRGHNTDAENKYMDQANDAATVRYWRQQNGTPEWYRKKYGHTTKEQMEEATAVAPAPGDRWKDHAVMVNTKTSRSGKPQRVVVHRKNVGNYPEADGWKEVSPGQVVRKEEVCVEEQTDDQHFASQSKKMQTAINLHLRKGKSYKDAVAAAKVHVKEELDNLDENRYGATGAGAIRHDLSNVKSKEPESKPATTGTKHRILFTLSDPNHPSVSMRKELKQKHVHVTADDKDTAMKKGKAHFKKLGYKIHDAEHVGMNESVEVISEAEDKSVARLKQLVRFGLMDKSKLPLLQRALSNLDKGNVTNPTERQVLFDLLNDLVGIITGDDATFSKIKLQVQK